MIKSTLLFLMIFAVAPAHQFHVSKTTLRYVAEREQIQIEMHVFLDDLELALTEAGAPNLYIGTDKEMPQTAKHLALYLEKHFKIYWNDRQLPVGMLGYELSEDLQALWIYGQAKTRQAPGHIAVQNSMLTEIYDDQKNMVKVEAGSQRTTLLMSKDRPKGEYKF